VDVFLKNKKVDFHIGVTAAWDSKLFGSAPRKFRNGELRPVTDGSGQRFVTNATKNLHDTLAKSLHIGFEPYLKNDPSKSGPESEELFSPMLAAFSQEMKDGPNKGFRRSDAHLAVVVVTDTEDSTPDALRPGQFMQAQEVIEQLNREVQSGTTLTVLAALARLDEMRQYQNRQEPGLTTFNQKFQNGSIKQCNSYTVDPGIVGPLQGPYQIADLVRRAKGEAFDLVTKDFGSKMASLGRTLVSKALSYTINLDRVPDLSEDFQVSINGKVIPRDDAKGWSYNPDSQTVRLNEGLDLSGLDSFEVSIDFTIFE
jgi:hypothetical protein